jgi:hypothetical protein
VLLIPAFIIIVFYLLTNLHPIWSVCKEALLQLPLNKDLWSCEPILPEVVRDKPGLRECRRDPECLPQEMLGRTIPKGL